METNFRKGVSVLCICFFALSMIAQSTIKGHVEDKVSGESLIGANVVWAKDEKIIIGTITDLNGDFELSGLLPGTQTLLVRYLGYEKTTEVIEVEIGEEQSVVIKMTNDEVDFPTVEITGASPNAIKRVHGAATKLDKATIQLVKPMGTQEALAQVPGINGFSDDGMENSRISIGIRGLYPRRSSRVLILEDGVPIQPAIYIYPNAYYNPPVERIDEIEIIKGSGAIKFGPQTMGGVINYITKRPRPEPGGTIQLTGGMNGYFSAFAEVGGWGNNKIHPEVQLIYKRGDGYRENNTFNQLNGTFKLNWFPSTNKSIYLKLNVNHENSNATYTGLTEYSFNTNPKFNPKANDEFNVFRAAVDLIYTHEISDKLLSKTKGFFSYFDRDWWRENDVFITASYFNSEAYTPGMFIAPQHYANVAQQLTGDIVRIGNGEDNFGILREFYVAGIEHTYKWKHKLFGQKSNLDIGARAYFERFKDNYKFGFSPLDREGVHFYEDTILVDGELTPRLTLGKSKHYETYAFSMFAEENLKFGKLSIQPGIRLEIFEQEQVDRLQNSALRDKTTIVVLPGLGFNYEFSKYNIFGGIHRGFTPPSSGTLTVQNFDGNTGEGFDLESEKSWNFELGARGNHKIIGFEASAFYLLIEDLVAAGRGTAFQNLGKVYTSGFESTLELKLSSLEGGKWLPDLFATYTYLKTGVLEARIDPTSSSPPEATSQGYVDIAGNALPYAPPHTILAGLSKNFDFGLQLRMEGKYVSSAFTDFENLLATKPVGNQGKTEPNFLLGASANYRINKYFSVFANGKNLLDAVYVGSRLHSSPSQTDAVGSSGIIAGPRRQITGGIKFEF